MPQHVGQNWRNHYFSAFRDTTIFAFLGLLFGRKNGFAMCKSQPQHAISTGLCFYKLACIANALNVSVCIARYAFCNENTIFWEGEIAFRELCWEVARGCWAPKNGTNRLQVSQGRELSNWVRFQGPRASQKTLTERQLSLQNQKNHYQIAPNNVSASFNEPR